MILIVGLRNPEKKYQHTRHSLGERVLGKLLVKHDFRGWTPAKLYTYAEGKIAEEEVALIMPLTYMNESGRAVKAALDDYRIDHGSLWVVHDDLDLPLGTVRVSQGASSAGHNGVQSIIEGLETKDFVRFRLGIETDRYQEIKEQNPNYAESYVLENFPSEEKLIAEEMISKAASAVILALEQDIEKAMVVYHR